MLQIPSRHLRFRPGASLCWLALLAIVAGTVGPARADDWFWNTGNGWFYGVTNWSPNGIPDSMDDIYIGNLPLVQNSTVMMGGGPISQGFAYLEVSDGMTLNTNGTELVSFGIARITGNASRIIATPQPGGPNEHDFQALLIIEPGGTLELQDNVAVRLFGASLGAGTIEGRGSIDIASNVAFVNNGYIRPSNNGGLTITQGVPGNYFDIDLDGTTGNGNLQLTQPFSVLTVNASGLTDSFGGTITMAPGALLAMNLENGWLIDSSGDLVVTGTGNPAASSQISGTALEFGGNLSINSNQAHLRFLAPVEFVSTADAFVGTGNVLTVDGPATVSGGQLQMAQNATMNFNGNTTLAGGQFITASNNLADGYVAFNGPTEWRGNVTIDGAARQNGNAVVAGGLGAVINAGTFDIDGVGNSTTWDINNNFVLNAQQISSTAADVFNGTINTATGFASRLSINLADPAASWTMGGQMNLNGNAAAAFHLERVAGSAMIVEGDTTVNHRVRIAADTTFANGSSVAFASPSSSLQMTGDTVVQAGTTFLGDGTLRNGSAGNMLLEAGLNLDSVGLVNDGNLRLDGLAGVVSVHQFENTADANLLVGIGGHLAGAEHDLLIVGGGSALLDGNLLVDLLDLGSGIFLPEVGDEFTIIASLGGINGEFLNDPVSSHGGKFFHWAVDYNPNDVVLRLDSVSIPEPSAGLLTAICGLLFLGRRRNRNVSGRGANPAQQGEVRARVQRPSFRNHFVSRLCSVGAVAALALAAIAPGAARADDYFWITGNGNWSGATNWSPDGPPGAGDFAFIGGWTGVEDDPVFLDHNVTISGLALSDEMYLGTAGNWMVVNGITTVWEDATLNIENAGPGVDFQTENLYLSDGGTVILNDATVRIGEQMFIGSAGSLARVYPSNGVIEFASPFGTTLINDGVIQGGPGSMFFVQLGGGLFDLDGVANNGSILLSGFGQANMVFTGQGLSDSFSGSIHLGPDAWLVMDLAIGWVADENSEIRVLDAELGAPSIIDGSHVRLEGAVNVLGQGADLQVLADATIAPSANIFLDDFNSLFFEASSNTVIEGGNFTLDHGGLLRFLGDTTIEGGTFTTESEVLSGGSVGFIGNTTWNGNVTFNGLAIQNGDATVVGPTVINADTFDMDGVVLPTWNVNHSLTVNANAIDSPLSSIFNGTMNVSGGFAGHLAINLSDPAARWEMAGVLNLTGVAAAAFPINRMAGSGVDITGNVNVAHRVRVTNDLTFESGSSLNFASPSARLQATGQTIVREGTVFTGAGLLDNGVSGHMVLEDGVVLDEVGLVNRGLLEIGNSPGIATVNRFENTDTGTWQVEIGGELAGTEFDRLLVSGGPVMLDGMLEVDLIDTGAGTFLPEIGDEFTILFSLGNVSGQFANDPVSLANGMLFHWTVHHNPHDITLELNSISSSVPEPAACGLVLLLGLGLLVRNRRSRR